MVIWSMQATKTCGCATIAQKDQSKTTTFLCYNHVSRDTPLQHREISAEIETPICADCNNFTCTLNFDMQTRPKWIKLWNRLSSHTNNWKCAKIKIRDCSSIGVTLRNKVINDRQFGSEAKSDARQQDIEIFWTLTIFGLKQQLSE